MGTDLLAVFSNGFPIQENGMFRCTPSSGDNFNALNFMTFAILTASMATNNNNNNDNNANLNMFTISVTNMNMNMVMGRKNPFITFLSMLKEDIPTSLQRLLISAKSGDNCGLLLWCKIGWMLGADDSRSVSRVKQHLVYLLLAEMAGTNGETFVQLVKLHRNGTCDAMRSQLSMFSCF